MGASYRIWATARSTLSLPLQRARCEAGDSLIEVVVAAMLVGLVAIATFAGFDVAGRSGTDSKRHSQANQLAQQDEDRLRGYQVSDLVGLSQTKTVVLDGTTFTVASKSYFVADASGTSSCTTSGTGKADYLKTESTVTWANMAPRTPVVAESVITPPAGGSMLVQVVDNANNPVSNMSVALTGTGAGTTPSASATTDSNGCALFGGLVDGAYNVSVTQPGPPPWVDPNGNTSPPAAQQATTVVAGTTDKVSFQFAQAGRLYVAFNTTYGGTSHPSSADTFVALNNGLAAPNYRLFGTAGSYFSSEYSADAKAASPWTVFPFTTPYTLYAGSCAADAPSANLQSSDPSFTVTSNNTAATATPTALTVPAVIVKPYAGTSGAPGSLLLPGHVTVTDTGCSNRKRAYSGGTLTNPASAQGALADPGQPYGSYSVCADATITYTNGQGTQVTGPAYLTATVANNNPNGTTVPFYFGGTSPKPTYGSLCP